MKKSLYIPLLASVAVLSFSSCKNEIEDIFEKSAAERLEQAKADYSEFLVKDGGKWHMEYFANTGEEGYNYVVTFNADGSVVMSGKNKYIGYAYTGELDPVFASETSLWDVIADNGPVLSFSSYNQTFHIFSEPEDIPGTTNPDTGTEIDETGKGHEGDYEFMLMDMVDENTLRLKGKKTGYTIYMHRLDANVNDADFFASIDELSAKLFSIKFPDLIFTDETGERFVLNNAITRIISAYPEAGDPVTQTETANAILTESGLRFMDKLYVQRSNGVDSIGIQSFRYNAEKGTLDCVDEFEGAVSGSITAPSPNEIIVKQGYAWQVDVDDLGGNFLTLYNNVVAAFKERPVRENFRYFQFGYSAGKYALMFQSGKYKGAIYCTANTEKTGEVTFTFDGTCDKNAEYYYQTVAGTKAALDAFINALKGTSFTLSTPSLILPNQLKLTSQSNPSDYLVLNIQ